MMCKEKEESINHLFVHCSMAYRIWGFFLSHLKVSWSFPYHFQDVILSWRNKELDGLPSVIWQFLPSVICWVLWLERNDRIFKDKSRSQVEILVIIFNLLFEWVSIRDDFEESV